MEEKNTHNGYEFVDLGLPSGLLWATCNVGATSPEQAGLYFAWGETVGFSDDQVENGERSFSSSEYKLGSAASISTDLTLEQDAAHSYMGGKWRMPTKAEFEELFSNTTQKWTLDYDGTGVVGHIFVSKSNGNSVFFPAAGRCDDSPLYKSDLYGRYWTASWDSKHCALYSCLGLYKVSFSRFGNYGVVPGYRDCGRPVRAVVDWPAFPIIYNI